MEQTINLIKNFFEGENWKYNYEEYDGTHAFFSSGIRMNNALGKLKIIVIVRQDYYIVNAILNNTVEERYFNQVSEYLHRANNGMSNGNFEFDFEDGEVKFKTYVNFDGVQLSKNVIVESILIPIFMFEKYGKNLLRLMVQEADPKELIKEVEKDDTDDLATNDVQQ